MKARRSILDILMSAEWLITNIYGKYADSVVYDQSKEKAKQKLYHLYGYKNIYKVLPPELDEVKIMDHMRTLMQIDIMNNPEMTAIQGKINE